ncbi:MAG: hypothetical protein JSV62_03900 [Promethearchaeota archaeon]|nr:MAG: hypothetical protein JSV62_03900 [Candidatus Lokiarchaeota archaeon]
MALGILGFLDGITALIVVLTGSTFGLFSLYKAVKLKAKLLGISGLCLFCIGFLLLGPTVDFITILITNNNIELLVLYGLLSYSWAAPLTIFGLYIGGELLLPTKKWIIVTFYLVLAVIYEVIIFYFAFTTPEAIFSFPNPLPNGTALLNTGVKLGSITFILMIFFLVSGLIFNGVGFLNKGIKASGDLRKRFLYLSLGWIIFIICGAFDGLFDPGIITVFVRIAWAVSIVFMHLGIRL